MQPAPNFGQSVEDLFWAECKQRNIDIRRPADAFGPHDFEIMAKGRLLNIQVKGTATLRRKLDHRGNVKDFYYRVRVIRHSPTIPRYADAGVDYMAIYVRPLGEWYFIEAAALTGQQLHIRPFTNGKMEAARGAWALLGDDGLNLEFEPVQSGFWTRATARFAARTSVI